jgi:hypothetical protein
MSLEPSKARNASTRTSSLAEFRSVFADFRDLSALGLKGIIVAPISAVWLKTGLPLPSVMALATSVLVLVAQVWTFQAWYKLPVPRLRKRIPITAMAVVISLLAFIVLLVLFTVQPVKGEDRVVEGWIVRSNVKPLLNSDYTEENALRDSQYEAKEIWTTFSIGVTTAALQVTWIGAFTAFSAFLSTFIILQRRRPQ